MILYKPSKHAFFTEGDSLTEQEHTDSCDINKMMRNLERGYNVRMSKTGPWHDGATDDLTMDSVSYRIAAEENLRELNRIVSEDELDEDVLKIIPDSVKQKFKFKTKKKASSEAIKNDDLNDDKNPPSVTPSKS